MAIEVEVKHRRFTLGEYHRMIDAGILGKRDRVELIRGEIVHMTPIGLRHSASVAFLIQRLVMRLADGALLWPGLPLMILPDSEPEPDIVLVKPREDFYRSALPQPADVLLLIEVSDSSLRYDRTVKRTLCAEAGIAEYWIVNLQQDGVEVHRQPHRDGYQHVERIGRGGIVASQAFPDVVLLVDDILG